MEVADKANPPVCRIMDYGKYKYEVAQKTKESRKKATHISVKEMKYRPKIGPGDFDTKTRKVKEFLEEGHKVKLTIMFRGREVQHPELGKKILDNVAEIVDEIAKIEAYPRLDGRNMTMVLAPDKKAQQKRRERTAEEEAAGLTLDGSGTEFAADDTQPSEAAEVPAAEDPVAEDPIAEDPVAEPAVVAAPTAEADA